MEFHNKIIITNVNIGDSKKIALLENEGIILYFSKSLIPSSKGCLKPQRVLLFGPSRFCLKPKIFRSKRVINITLISSRIANSKKEVINNSF